MLPINAHQAHVLGNDEVCSGGRGQSSSNPLQINTYFILSWSIRSCLAFSVSSMFLNLTLIKEE